MTITHNTSVMILSQDHTHTKRRNSFVWIWMYTDMDTASFNLHGVVQIATWSSQSKHFPITVCCHVNISMLLHVHYSEIMLDIFQTGVTSITV